MNPQGGCPYPAIYIESSIILHIRLRLTALRAKLSLIDRAARARPGRILRSGFSALGTKFAGIDRTANAFPAILLGLGPAAAHAEFSGVAGQIGRAHV